LRPVYNRPQGPFQDGFDRGEKPVDPVDTPRPKFPLFEEKSHAPDTGESLVPFVWPAGAELLLEEKSHAAELPVARPAALVRVASADVSEGSLQGGGEQAGGPVVVRVRPAGRLGNDRVDHP
jgi:hypothetical protein